MNKSYPSICIPCIYSYKMTKPELNRIFRKIFEKDIISKIKIIKIEKGLYDYKKIIIDLYEWPDNRTSKRFRDLLINGKEVKIVNEGDLYIKCVAYNNKKYNNKIYGK